METPLSIQLDGSSPGTFVLAGTLNMANLEHFVPVIRQLLFLGQKELVINMEKIEQIDKESIRYLLNLFMSMKENGGHLTQPDRQAQVPARAKKTQRRGVHRGYAGRGRWYASSGSPYSAGNFPGSMTYQAFPMSCPAISPLF